MLRCADGALPTRARKLTMVATDVATRCHVGNHGADSARSPSAKQISAEVTAKAGQVWQTLGLWWRFPRSAWRTSVAPPRYPDRCLTRKAGYGFRVFAQSAGAAPAPGRLHRPLCVALQRRLASLGGW